MGEVPPLTKLYRDYRTANFQFFVVYAREAHPGENYPHHASLEQKLAHACTLRTLEQIQEIPILVDDFAGTTHRAYGLLPNMTYLIDRDGIVVIDEVRTARTGAADDVGKTRESRTHRCDVRQRLRIDQRARRAIEAALGG